MIEIHRESRSAFFAGLAGLAAAALVTFFFIPYLEFHQHSGIVFTRAIQPFFFITGLSMLLMIHRHRRFELVPVFVTAGTIAYQLGQYLLTGESTPGKTLLSLMACVINLLFALYVFGSESEEEVRH